MRVFAFYRIIVMEIFWFMRDNIWSALRSLSYFKNVFLQGKSQRQVFPSATASKQGIMDSPIKGNSIHIPSPACQSCKDFM